MFNGVNCSSWSANETGTTVLIGFAWISFQGFAVRREMFQGGREGRNVYFTLTFAGIALMAAVFVGVAVAKWRSARSSPHAQGFVEVDQVGLH